MANPLGPWQPRAVAKLVANGCDEERAKRIAASVESGRYLTAEDSVLLMESLDREPANG